MDGKYVIHVRIYFNWMELNADFYTMDPDQNRKRTGVERWTFYRDAGTTFCCRCHCVNNKRKVT